MASLYLCSVKETGLVRQGKTTEFAARTTEPKSSKFYSPLIFSKVLTFAE